MQFLTNKIEEIADIKKTGVKLSKDLGQQLISLTAYNLK